MDKLDAAISEWSELRASMRDVDNDRLRKKLRLEWNYNSNHIEGNTLTYHETELLLVFGRTNGGHLMRHYEEMKAHDVAIKHVRRLANEERLLSESDVRDLNRILLKEPFGHVAQPADGQPTRKRIRPGGYKTQPNRVMTATGELHRFAEPEETPALMERWTSNFRRGLRQRSIPLPRFLARSHWDFVRIHPFDDGNGRTARLLTNYALLRLDLPPMVIKSVDRERYVGALEKADSGDCGPLERFMFDNALWSLAIATKAAKGEPIDEVGDVGKRLAIFARQRTQPPLGVSDLERLDLAFHQWIRPTLQRIELDFSCLESLFDVRQSRDFWSSQGAAKSNFILELIGDWEKIKKDVAARAGLGQITNQEPVVIGRNVDFLTHLGRGTKGFDMTLSVAWKLGDEEASVAADIDGEPIASANRVLHYSDLDGMDPDMGLLAVLSG